MRLLILFLLPLSLFAQTSSILISNTHIVDVRNGMVLHNQFVLVKGNRISRISNHPFQVKNAVLVDGTGKYLMPGLCDFNAQVLNYEHNGIPAFSLMLANGVTSVRDILPEQNLKEAFAIKDKIAKRQIPGPRLYLSGKTLIDRIPFQEENIRRSWLMKSPAEAQKAVDQLILMGADVVDIRTILDKKILQAIIKRSHENGVKVLARYSGSWLSGSQEGIDAFSHISDLWRTVSVGREKYYRFSEGDSMRFVSVPEFYNRVLPSFGGVDTSFFYALVDTFLKRNTSLCLSATSFKPSLIRFEIGDSSRAAFRTQKQKELQADFLKTYNEITLEQVKGQKPQISFVILAAKKGIPIIAGTQMEDFTTPGMSLHDMLFWLVDGGLSPAEAIRAATINPASFLGRSKNIGTVAVGKLADLVLLEANPLTDISNTRKIAAVIADGRLLRKKDIEQLTESAKEAVRGR